LPPYDRLNGGIEELRLDSKPGNALKRPGRLSLNSGSVSGFCDGLQQVL
jgi:hypothetical protein